MYHVSDGFERNRGFEEFKAAEKYARKITAKDGTVCFIWHGGKTLATTSRDVNLKVWTDYTFDGAALLL